MKPPKNNNVDNKAPNSARLNAMTFPIHAQKKANSASKTTYGQFTLDQSIGKSGMLLIFLAAFPAEQFLQYQMRFC